MQGVLTLCRRVRDLGLLWRHGVLYVVNQQIGAPSDRHIPKVVRTTRNDSSVEVEMLLDALRIYICDTSSPPESFHRYLHPTPRFLCSGQRDIEIPASALSYLQDYVERSLQASRVLSSVRPQQLYLTTRRASKFAEASKCIITT